MGSSSGNIGNDHADLYSQLWHACAGLTTKAPQIGDRVFYFPQGHLEMIKEFMKDEDDRSVPNYGLPPKLLCEVVDVKLKAFPDTDEVFAEMELLPCGEEGEKPKFKSVDQKAPSFRKVLTTSDASTHGGCGLPKAAVERTFPPLCVKDASVDYVFQDLVAKDLHGATWKFRHIYRGDPKRHLLGHGWNKFAGEKKLKAGDTCFFLRGLAHDEIYIGVQRAVRMQKECTDVTASNMRRGVLVSASFAMETKSSFSVIYHPRMCESAFIVPYDKVMESLNVGYPPEMGFAMLVDGGDDHDHISKKVSGIITGQEDIDPARWPNSEWRCLKVKWNVTASGCELPSRVSPWDIKVAIEDVLQLQLAISVDRKRPMPFQPIIRDNPVSRISEVYPFDGLQRQWLTLSLVDTGSSSHQDEAVSAEDK